MLQNFGAAGMGATGLGIAGMMATQAALGGSLQKEENLHISGNQRFMLMQSLNRDGEIETVGLN